MRCWQESGAHYQEHRRTQEQETNRGEEKGNAKKRRRDQIVCVSVPLVFRKCYDIYGV